MMIFKCIKCEQQLEASDESVNTRIKCPSCGQLNAVREPEIVWENIEEEIDSDRLENILQAERRKTTRGIQDIWNEYLRTRGPYRNTLMKYYLPLVKRIAEQV